jgi:hypothetical protein
MRIATVRPSEDGDPAAEPTRLKISENLRLPATFGTVIPHTLQHDSSMQIHILGKGCRRTAACNATSSFAWSPTPTTTSFELGSLVDGASPSTKYELLEEVLEFFGMDTSGLLFEDGFESGDTSTWSATVP